VSTQKIRRFASVTGLKPEMATRYSELHSNPWPGVSQIISQCHIRNYSIHVQEIGGKPYLFAYFEYTGEDFDADMARMAADPETRRWWSETDPCQEPLPEAAALGKIWTETREVFYQA
jgi:L-rhamnose mutarotase